VQERGQSPLASEFTVFLMDFEGIDINEWNNNNSNDNDKTDFDI
jgi:hypothetical protein